MQFVVISDAGYEEMDGFADQLIGRAMGSGNFQFLQKSIDIDRPTINAVIDRDRAGDLGINNASVVFDEAPLLNTHSPISRGFADIFGNTLRIRFENILHLHGKNFLARIAQPLHGERVAVKNLVSNRIDNVNGFRSVLKYRAKV